MTLHRKSKKSKAKLYSLEWDIFEAARLVEMYKVKHGRNTPLSYRALHAIYRGNLLPAIYFKEIPPNQKFGVTYIAHATDANGIESIIEHNIKLSEPMTYREFMKGYEHCYTHHGHGLKTKGWVGVKDYWLGLIRSEYPDHKFHSVKAKANCLVK